MNPTLRIALPRLPILLALLLTGCAGSGVYVSDTLRERIAETDSARMKPSARPAFRVLLVGDAGAPNLEAPDPVLALLRHHAEAAGPNSATVFLGDNVYANGLPPEDDPRRAEAEARLQVQIDAVDGVPGRVVFVPGNHDWKHSRPGGLAQVRRQEAFVEAALGPGTFLPSNGFPGPVAVDLTDHLRLLVIDTEWWLGRYARGEGDDPEAEASVGTDDDFLLALADALERAGDRRVLVVGHHPLLSEGDHSGAVPPDRHLFPLLALHPRAYLPLPFLGSLAIAVKRFQGEDHQDLGHPRYRALRDALTDLFAPVDGLVYAAGHDHSLQYHEILGSRQALRQIISGSGSEGDFVLPRDALFAAPRRGLVALTYAADGSAVMEVIVPAEGRPAGEVLVRAPILPPRRDAQPTVALAGPAPVLPDSAVTPASLRYDAAGGVLRSLIGEGYRRTWATPVQAPVLDVGAEGGGLTPFRTGGDRQSRSLWLRAADGRILKLRSIEKHPANPFGLGFTSGRLHEWAQDVTSGVYPYAAPVAARLSDAVGLYHTAPRVVYVPDDPRLGSYRTLVADRLMVLEEHPDASGEGRPHFGHAWDLISPSTLRRALDRDADHRVDATFYLRARLFDMLIGDWDRHQDQWRWAAFEPGDLDPALTGDAATKGKVYRPVARDRDFALNNRDGLLFDLARPRLPKLQGLQHSYGNIGGLTRSGRDQDRRFLAPLGRDAYREAARNLQATLTDSVLARALDVLPAEVRGQDREPLFQALRARRDALDEAAQAFFEILNGTLDVVGSHDHEIVHLTWMDGDRLELRVAKRTGEGAFPLWARVVEPGETTEVRIWSRGGDDRFVVTGRRGRGAPRVRLLPGAGADVLDDQTDGDGLSAYDGRDVEALRVDAAGPRARIDRTNRIPTAAYGYTPAASSSSMPLVVVGLNGDDGLVLGGGLELTHVGFGRERFVRRHRVTASVATATGGVAGRYRGTYPDALGPHDLALRLEAQTPMAARNFFGYGDGIDPQGNVDPFRVRLARAEAEPLLERTLPGRLHAWVGPTLRYARPDLDSTRFLVRADLPARDLEAQLLTGVVAGLDVDAVDRGDRPTQGARFALWGRGLTGLLDGGYRYVGLGTALTLYATHPRLQWATLAVRGGGEHRVGTFPFYDAATLGGPSTVRGYPSDRFAGRSSVYATAEPRVLLSRFRMPVTGFAEAGVLAFVDTGRVWSDGAPATWHTGMGGGVWLSLPGVTNLTATLDASSEYRQVAVRAAFAL